MGELTYSRETRPIFQPLSREASGQPLNPLNNLNFKESNPLLLMITGRHPRDWICRTTFVIEENPIPQHIRLDL